MRSSNAPSAICPLVRNERKGAGGKALTTSYWFPDAAFGGGAIGLFETLKVVETVEIGLYLIGVRAFARGGEDPARACAEAMGTEAVHRALVRFAQGELGEEIGPPNDAELREFRLAHRRQRAQRA